MSPDRLNDMECFYDGQDQAVAVCQSCGKGVCHKHVTEVGSRVSCNQGECAAHVQRLSAILDLQRTAIRRANGFLPIAMGAGFAGFAIYTWTQWGQNSLSYWLLFMALIFVFFGARQFLAFRSGRRDLDA